ncbi:MAG: hypothetical protein HYX75_23120 [Acidobacteria bacterium]|nr:hypothetical protein [Acidobacteriota bacterium]
MRQMMKLAIAGVVSLLVLTTGCFRQETLHSLYISPCGGVRWMIVEKDVRSDASGEEAQRNEEQRWLAQTRNGDHPVAEAFRALGPSSVTWRIVRDTRPFVVVTEAEFGGIDELGQSFLDQLGMRGQSELATADGGFRWTLTVFPSEDQPESADDSPVTHLLVDAAESYCIIVEEGRFIDAVGFDLSEGSTVARPAERKEYPKDGTPLVFSLTWRIADEGGAGGETVGFSSPV